MGTSFINQSQAQFSAADDLTARIANIHQEAIAHGAGKLTGRERVFLSSIYAQSQHTGFVLSLKQRQWFLAIAKRLEATQGKLAVQIIGEKHRSRYRHYRDSYAVACFGY